MNDFFKVLSDETRLRCLFLIFENNEVCVCELIHALALPQSKISRHLSIIKLNTLITQRRFGQWVLYSVNSNLSDLKKEIIKISFNNLKNTSPFKNDRVRLHSMKNRPLITKDITNV
jgi:ArsR family transcriptional regulator